jgi:hypothetical protein
MQLPGNKGLQDGAAKQRKRIEYLISDLGMLEANFVTRPSVNLEIA